jgi:hypothetical protein
MAEVLRLQSNYATSAAPFSRKFRRLLATSTVPTFASASKSNTSTFPGAEPTPSAVVNA